MKAMLLAAGFGTRLKPFTDYHPKALAEVNNKSLLQINIEYLQQFGISDVIVNVHHFTDQIIRVIKKNNGWGSSVTISDEKDNILETGGGLKHAEWYFKNEKDFVLMNVDVLTDLPLNKMIAYQKAKPTLATLATTNRQTSRYFLFDEDDVLCGWKNTNNNEEIVIRHNTQLNSKAFSGIHVISAEIFSLIKHKEIKFSMVDIYLSLCAENRIISFDHSGSKFIDVGKPESLKQAAFLFSNDFK